MSNKGFYKEEEKSFQPTAVVKEEAPIEEAPIAAKIEVKEDIKEIPEVRHEVVKPAPQVKAQPKQQAKVILITRDGCIAEDIKHPGNNISFYGAKFLVKKIGDIIEF